MDEKPKVCKAAIYCRVSKDDQNPKNQEAILREYADNHNYTIYNIYTDTITGSKSSRPELNKMLFDARKKMFTLVIAWKLDRLGRSLKHLINITEEWYKLGIDFICVSQNIDTTTAAGKLTFYILGAVAEFERELISERTKAGFYRDKDGVLRGRKTGKPVGKRGKDEGQRNKSGYYRRWENVNKKMGG